MQPFSLASSFSRGLSSIFLLCFITLFYFWNLKGDATPVTPPPPNRQCIRINIPWYNHEWQWQWARGESQRSLGSWSNTRHYKSPPWVSIGLQTYYRFICKDHVCILTSIVDTGLLHVFYCIMFRPSLKILY